MASNTAPQQLLPQMMQLLQQMSNVQQQLQTQSLVSTVNDYNLIIKMLPLLPMNWADLLLSATIQMILIFPEILDRASRFPVIQNAMNWK